MAKFEKVIRKERILFLLLITFQICFFSYLIAEKRMVIGHDGFQYFQLQYYFLNNAVEYHQIPQWIPFMTHGIVANWWYFVQAGILQNILFFIAPLLKNLNFLPIFHLGMFVDELVLLVGSWLLAKRFFSSVLTTFFVVSSVVLTSVWMTQPWWNFHLYYAFPLLLYLLHNFIDTLKWKYFLLAVSLLALQGIGNIPYFLSIISLSLGLYFLFYLIFNPSARFNLQSLRFNSGTVFSLLLILVSFAGIYGILRLGTDQIVNYDFGRDVKSFGSLKEFLSYGGNLNLNKWIELVVGVSPALDYTLYMGFLPVIFLMLGFRAVLDKKYIHFFLTFIGLLLFSLGTVVSVFFYYAWPMMKLVRHLALVSSLIKVFLCFLSGFCFEAVLIKENDDRNLTQRILLFISALLIAFLAIKLWSYAGNYREALGLVKWMLSEGGFIADGKSKFTFHPGLPIFLPALNQANLFLQIFRCGTVVLLSAIIFAFMAFVNHKKYFNHILLCILLIHLIDILGYRLSESRARTVSLSEECYQLTRFQKMPYLPKRQRILNRDNPREKILGLVIDSGGQLYWTYNAFFFEDELGSSFRVNYWLLPLDAFIRTYEYHPLYDFSIKPKGLIPYMRFDFPSSHQAVEKITGIAEDKVQFFTKAYLSKNDPQVSSFLTDTSYQGDSIFLSGDSIRKDNQGLFETIEEKSVSKNFRLRLPYEILRFDSNNFEMIVDCPQKTWLYYSDVWHPFWKATINSKPVPVFKANLAYKAVPLEKGPNSVHFYFQSKMMSFLHVFFGINALFWLCMIFWLTRKILFNSN